MEISLGERFDMPAVLVLGAGEIRELISMGEALGVVEKAFRLGAEGKAVMPPKLYLELPDYHGDFRAMPCYVDGIAGLKWVCAYPDNRRHNLPSVIATIILSDPKTGCPLAIMDGTYITEIRTGAAGGIAAKYLATGNSSVVGIVGAGVQARTQLTAISQVLTEVRLVKVFDRNKDASLKYVRDMEAELNIDVRAVETVREATEADVVVTATPSTTPVVSRQYIRAGTHINAIGADAKGKQELEGELLKSAKVVVDDFGQACHSGEINVPLSRGMLKVDEVYGTLGEVVANAKRGRENDQEITVFDSTGLAIQDIACARFVYEKAKGRKGSASH